jgi:hypothetical protein
MPKTYIDKSGYRRFTDSDDLVHRWVVRKHGYHLSRHQQVHHRDGNKLNNDISNLEIVSRGNHERIHGKKVSFPYRMFITSPFWLFIFGSIGLLTGGEICSAFGLIIFIIGGLLLLYNLKYVYGYI